MKPEEHKGIMSFEEIVASESLASTESNPINFKFNLGQDVYVKNYKKNGVISHREFHDNGEHQWKQYVVRVLHEDGRSEGIECSEYWIEGQTRRED